MDIIDKFVEFLINANCNGCKLCEPRLSKQWQKTVCVEEGRAKWFLQMAAEFKKQEETK